MRAIAATSVTGLTSLLFGCLLACGGGGDVGAPDGRPPPTIDAMTAPDAPTDRGLDAADAADAPVDARPDAPVDAAPDAPLDAAPDALPQNPACTIAASLGTITPRSPQVSSVPGPPREVRYVDPLDASSVPDVFKLYLIEGRGAFAAGIATGTFPLSGPETAYATCGACVEIFSDVDASNNFAAFYLARAGSLTLTSVTPRLTGTLSNVTLVHLNDDDTVNADGCTTHFDTLAFDVPAPPTRAGHPVVLPIAAPRRR